MVDLYLGTITLVVCCIIFGVIARIIFGVITMPSFRDLYKTPLLSAKRMTEKEIKGVITAVYPETIKGSDGKTSDRLVIEIGDAEFRLALNKGNAIRLGEKFGEEYDQWVGKKVSITKHKTQYMGSPTDGLLVTPLGK